MLEAVQGGGPGSFEERAQATPRPARLHLGGSEGHDNSELDDPHFFGVAPPSPPTWATRAAGQAEARPLPPARSAAHGGYPPMGSASCASWRRGGDLEDTSLAAAAGQRRRRGSSPGCPQHDEAAASRPRKAPGSQSRCLPTKKKPPRGQAAPGESRHQRVGARRPRPPRGQLLVAQEDGTR